VSCILAAQACGGTGVSMVSKYVVDAALIVGLVIALVGTFFLSYGLFGDSWNRPRQILVGLAYGVYFGIGFNTWYLIGLALTGGDRFGFSPARLAIEMLLGFFCGYFIGGQRHMANSLRRLIKRPIFLLSFPVVFTIFVVVFVYTFHYFVYFFYFYWPETTEVAIIGLYGGLALVYVFILVPNLSPRQLQIVGFVPTVLGIATQFLPPILNLLNIQFW
jgi:hypothetical protein